MSSPDFTGTDVAAIIGAVGGATAAIITALNRRTATTTEKKVDAHDEILKRIDPG